MDLQILKLSLKLRYVKLKFSIIIRTLNEKKNLEVLFKILESQKNKSFEVILIDSGSTDGTLEFIDNYKFKFPFILTKINQSEFSFGRSLNRAIKLSTYKEVICCISAHCFPQDNEFLTKLMAHFIYSNTGLVYGKQIPDERSPLSEANHLGSWFKDGYLNEPNIFCNNGCSAFKYEVWNMIKFDESASGCEDLIFSHELYRKNLKVIYEPNAVVSHYHNENFKNIFNRYKREAMIVKSFLMFNYGLMDLIKCTLREVLSDLSFRKNVNYKRRNLLSILGYRISKNLGQYLAPNLKDTKTFHLDKKDRENLLKHYFYSL